MTDELRLKMGEAAVKAAEHHISMKVQNGRARLKTVISISWK
jgi:hypothetical protein